MRRLAPLLLVCSCGSDPAALVVEISSPLTIPTETNDLLVRVLQNDEEIEQASNALGSAPRDQWPQTLPVLIGDVSISQLDLQVILRMNRPGIYDPEPVGYATLTVDVPEEGTTGNAQIEVPRLCTDADGDDYGTGAGCVGPDCDDGDANVPNPTPCPTIACSAGGTECGGGQVCYENECVPACEVGIIPCGGLHLTCKEPENACICRDTCIEDNDCRFCWPSQEDCQVSVGLTCQNECCAA